MENQADGMVSGGRLIFWRGLLTGIGLALVLLTLLAGFVVRRGVEVTVQTAEISRRMEAEIRQAVRQELPRTLAGFKAELPRQVASQAGQRMAAIKLDIGGFEVPVPQTAVREMEQAVEQAMRTGLEAAVNRVDVNGLAVRLGDQAARLADRRLKEVLAQQVIAVELLPGLKIPVRLVPR